MNIKFAFRGTFLGLPQPYIKNNRAYYSVSLMVDGEVGRLSCEEKVYERIAEGGIQFGDTCLFNALYSCDYRFCRIERFKVESKAS